MSIQPLLPLVEHAVAMCAAQSRVGFDVRPALGDVQVAADAAGLTQALVVLLSHAARCAPAGAVVDVSVQRNAATARIAVSGVADDGQTLRMVAAIIEQHRGTTGFSHPDQFYADLPLAGPPRNT